MRIPLDYYRILGLPVQTSGEQLQVAYRDRTMQLPRREYSEAAIEARIQLIEQAYKVLADPQQRADYDASYFAYAYDRDSDGENESPKNRPESFLAGVDPYTPSIEIAKELFVGALLILQELGEYELVLNLGRPYFDTNNLAGESKQTYQPDQVQADIVLTVTLACLELGREQWQQGQYENAASSLETGKDLLSQTALFPTVETEIQADLYKLRPYRILELLSLPAENITERRHGLKLLQDILQQRGGIDGTADDGSGLSVDDFLRFIQQLRSYLTVSEQQTLFAAESQRPSAVASYLQVYALIARGFAYRMPMLIRQAKLLLARLSKRQDLYLEQAVCSLLLGQTAAAINVLELSREYEAIAFIRENSQGSPDLLPGLCLYGERWLQTEVFPHFRDLAEQQASLKEYFEDEQVQAYLEALSAQTEATDELSAMTTAPALSADPHTEASALREQESGGAIASSVLTADESVATSASEQRVRHVSSRHEVNEETADLLPVAAAASRTATATSHAVATRVAVAPMREHYTRTAINQSTVSSPELGQPAAPRARKRIKNRPPRNWGASEPGNAPLSRPSRRVNRAGSQALAARTTRLALLLSAGVLAMVIFGFLIAQVYGWLRQAISPEPSLQGEQLLVQLDRPTISIPDPRSAALKTPEPLNQATARQVIQTWLSTKAAAFGPSHGIDRLEQILTAPVLMQWQQLAQRDRADNRYRQYKHNLKIDSVQVDAGNPDRSQVEASVHEIAQVYEDGRLNKNSSYDENLRIRYDLLRKNGQWRIREMRILR